jgi:hypothetical protein
MTRKLLPYEHQLIEELDVSEQEYLDFLQVQFDYTTTPEQRLEKPQAGVAEVALVLTIVGTLLQVASALLMPKPSSGGRRQPREQIFAPRIGFNSAQELAKYGDTVNLVYTNTSENPTGGVRVATSLIWSAIDSYGSSQFMQMMLVLGAGRINAIDSTRIAFGQTPIRQFATQRTWAYYNSSGNLRFDNLIAGDAGDPARLGASSSSLVYRTNPEGSERQEGFSQSFSPSTLTKCGVFFPIPINVDVADRNEKGGIKTALIGITIDGAFRNAYWASIGERPVVEPGTQFTMFFAQSSVTPAEKQDVLQTAAELRRTLFGGLDAASTYKLGSAKFRIASPIASADLDAGDIAVTFTCVERGSCPEEDYETTDYKQNEQDAINEIINRQEANIALQAQLNTNTPIYLSLEASSANIGPQLNRSLASIQAQLDFLVDFEENGNKTKNLSEIEASPFLPENINSVIVQIDRLEDQNEDLRDNKKSRRTLKANIKRIKELERTLKSLFSDFFDGSYRSTRKQRLRDIEQLRKDMITFAAAASGDGRDTAAEQARNAVLQNEINDNNNEIARQQRILDSPENWNDYFHTKCLVKVEEASYETITQCGVVDFALRSRVFMRVTGRSKKYGEKKEETFKNSDNGSKLRTALFWLWYRRNGAASWTRVQQVFAIRRGTDIDNYISLKFRANDNQGNWQFHFEPIAETASEMREFGFVDFAYIENSGGVQSIQNPDGTRIIFVGTVQARDFDLPPLNNNPSQIDEWSLFSTRSDTQLQFSFDNGPEIEIKAVTEQRIEALSTYPQLYNNLSLLGFNAYSGQGVQDLRSISAFVTQGRLVRRLRDDGTYPSDPDGASGYAPDIFLDTIIDGIDGIGRFAKPAGIDLQALALAKRFCQRNNLFMDCVIAERTPWRQFWAEVAPFSLLELGRIGGKETLVPALPVNNAGNVITRVPISALFNAGNILEDSYREEFIDYGSSVQDLIATVIFRDTEREGFFPRNNSVDVKLTGVTEAIAVRQTFDLSQFVTNRAQAILFAKLMCNQRRHIRKAIEFKTFPTDSVLSPGAYIYVDIGQAQWNNIYSGSINAGGVLNTPLGSIVNGTYTVLVWKSGQPTVEPLTSIAITDNSAAALAPYDGWLFVLGVPAISKRVFRITEVQMDEEGEVSVKGIEHPCDNDGNSLIATGVAAVVPGLFTIDTAPE